MKYLALFLPLCTLFPVASTHVADVDELLALEQNRGPLASTSGAEVETTLANNEPAAAPDAWTPAPGVLYAYG